MAEAEIDVLGIGNAIVDILVQTDEAFLTENGLEKGAMTLVDADGQQALYQKAGQALESSGGSAANTLAGVAALGGRAAFAGKVRADQLGGVFQHDIRAAGVQFETPPATEGAPTATCLVLITPDGQRTMQTYLGACVDFGPENLDLETVKAAKVTYLEGYLFDPAPAREAFYAASRAAEAAGREISLSLSDPFCVDRHRADFRDFIRDHVDLLFANEAEILSLFETEDLDAAIRQTRGMAKITAITRSEHGSLVVSGQETHHVAAAPIDRLVDTTGAGDAYAAGFLTAYTKGQSLNDAASLGGAVAAAVIQQIGARPPTHVAALRP